MISTRHLIPNLTYSELQRVAATLGYKEKGRHSKWKLLDKLLAYSLEHPTLFHL